jgi:hypothetical protein
VAVIRPLIENTAVEGGNNVVMPTGRLLVTGSRLGRALASALTIALGSLSPLVATAQAPAGPADRLERPVVTNSSAKCPDPRTYALTRPEAAAGPTVVGVGLFIQDVAALSDVDQTLDMDAYFVVRWLDPRLADSAGGEVSADCPLPTNLWMPKLEPERLRSRSVFYPDRFLVAGDGVVTLARRIWVKVSYPLSFRDFPIDRHRWVVTIWPVESREDEIVFHPIARMTGMSDRLSIQGWRVGPPRLEATTAVRDTRIGKFARLDAVFDLQRDWSYYAWKLGLPLTLIVLMAYGVYFIPSTAIPQQIGLGTTSMLTLIAYMLTLGATLPRIAYLTRADRFFVGSAALVFLGLLKAVGALALAQGPRASYIDRIDRWGRWIFPIAVLANLFFAFVL